MDRQAPAVRSRAQRRPERRLMLFAADAET
jgi:hypothetical protein